MSPVALPEPFSEPGTNVTTVSGWGDTTLGGNLSDVLMAVTIPIVPDDGTGAKTTNTYYVP